MRFEHTVSGWAQSIYIAKSHNKQVREALKTFVRDYLGMFPKWLPLPYLSDVWKVSLARGVQTNHILFFSATFSRIILFDKDKRGGDRMSGSCHKDSKRCSVYGRHDSDSPATPPPFTYPLAAPPGSFSWCRSFTLVSDSSWPCWVPGSPWTWDNWRLVERAQDDQPSVPFRVLLIHSCKKTMDEYELFMMPGPGWPYSWISIMGSANEEDFLNDVSTVFQEYGFRDWATQYFLQNR